MKATTAALALLLAGALPAFAAPLNTETLYVQPNETFVWGCEDFPAALATVTLVEVKRTKGVDATPGTLISELQVSGSVATTAIWRITPAGKADGNMYTVSVLGCDGSVPTPQCWACNGKVEIKIPIF